MKIGVTLGIIVLLGAAGAFFAWQYGGEGCPLFFGRDKCEPVDSFERCVQLGYPVTESQPRQCRAGDKVFTESAAPAEHPLIRVTSPRPNDAIKSPVTIQGEARGNWYFEASFPVKLMDANGKDIPLNPPYIMTSADWMTTEFVPFEATLSFGTPTTETGTLIFEKDNPSGLPENADSYSVPVRFDLSSVPKRTIKLYYYDADRDKDAAGNIMCSRQGLVAVNRSIPATNTPIQDAVHFLLRGELTAAEKSQGVTTEYPLSGVALTGASLKNGTLMLSFNDRENRTSGGACRAGILWFQIEATAKQFAGVNQVKFSPEELFQP